MKIEDDSISFDDEMADERREDTFPMSGTFFIRYEYGGVTDSDIIKISGVYGIHGISDLLRRNLAKRGIVRTHVGLPTIISMSRLG